MGPSLGSISLNSFHENSMVDFKKVQANLKRSQPFNNHIKKETTFVLLFYLRQSFVEISLLYPFMLDSRSPLFATV